MRRRDRLGVELAHHPTQSWGTTAVPTRTPVRGGSYRDPVVGGLPRVTFLAHPVQAGRMAANGHEVISTGYLAAGSVAAVDRDVLPRLPCSKNANDLAERGIGHPVFKAVFNGLEGLELIKTEVRGSWSPWASAEDELAYGEDAFVGDASLFVRGRGRVTRIRPTQVLLELVRRHGIKPYLAWRHFPRLSPPAPLQLSV